MKKLAYGSFLILLILVAGCGKGPAEIPHGMWTAATSEDGKTTVKYNITEIVDDHGKRNLLIRDSAETRFQADYQDCISLMKDVSVHKEFRGDASSELIETISDDEWIVYYYSDNPWPVADSDCVARMVFTEDQAGRAASFQITAAPDELESRGVNRLYHYQITYTFVNLGDGMVAVSFAGESIPPVRVPKWLVRSAFPKAQFDSLRKLNSLIEEM